MEKKKEWGVCLSVILGGVIEDVVEEGAGRVEVEVKVEVEPRTT